MKPQLFRKKPVEVEAVQVEWESWPDAIAWVGRAATAEIEPKYKTFSGVNIWTLEGTMRANVGDWIIKGVQGEFYPCKPDIFALTYEQVIV